MTRSKETDILALLRRREIAAHDAWRLATKDNVAQLRADWLKANRELAAAIAAQCGARR